VKRWETIAAVSVATLGLLAPAVVRADVPGYTYKVVVNDGYQGGTFYQVGNLNNKDQFTFNIVDADGVERIYAWDGGTVLKISDPTYKVEDGANFVTGNVWTPHGINDNGKVAFIGDVENGAGTHYMLWVDLADRKFHTITRPGDATPIGGTFADGGVAANGRMLADINNKDLIVFNQGVVGDDGNSNGAIWLYDIPTQKLTNLVHKGSVVTNDSPINQAWWPDINDNGQVTFAASVDGRDQFGLYEADGKGSITAIVKPGTKVEGVDHLVDQANWARINNNGDIVFMGEVGEGSAGPAEGITENTGVFVYTAADKKITKIIVPGDTLPGGGKWVGVEAARRPVGINDKGQVALVGIRDDEGGVLMLWDKENGLRELARSGSKLPGSNQVATAVGRGTNGGWVAYNIAINDFGDVAFPVQLDNNSGSFALALAPR
jgi:hypothetical protein